MIRGIHATLYAVCGLTPKNYNKLFLSAIGALDRKSWSSQALHDFFARQTGESARWPRDSEFEESWVTRPSYITLGPTKTRALLAEIERRKRGKLQETASLSSTLTVEHILPQEWREHWPLQGGVKPTPDEWKAASFSVHEDASRIGAIVRRNRTCHTIGNLTLLTQPLNATISNASFSKKKTAIDKQTVLLLNREIARENQWEEGQIEARARALFGLAKEIWVGPSS